MEYKNIAITDLKLTQIRDLRLGVLETLETRISESGYNPAKPLSVIESDGIYLVADGAHRLTIAKQIGITELPCVIYPIDSDVYKIGIKCNQDEDTYAPMDLFDYLGVIGSLKDVGQTQEQIGNVIGWSRDRIADYASILNHVVAENLNLAKTSQTGRATTNVANATIDFTEGWFRDILKLNPTNQELIINEYISGNGKLKGSALKNKVEKLTMYEQMVEYLHTNLLDKETDQSQIETDIYTGVFKTCIQLKKYIDKLNEDAKNQLIHGDCLDHIYNIEDGTIALLLTDPPYGIDFQSNRRTATDQLNKIENDTDNAFELLDNMLSLVQLKLTDDAHVYIFTSWKTYSAFEAIISQYLNIKNVIVWDKGNHGSGDLTGNYGERYELIIFADNGGNRELNEPRPVNILSYSKVSAASLEHPAQKPVDLLEYIISKSTAPGETVLDPFMGIGSVPVACGDRNSYIGIEMDDTYYKIAKRQVNE